MAVTFGLADYGTGAQILDLPVLEGASWSSMLNKPDELSCDIDMRDPDVRALDIPSSTEPKKTVLFASNPDGSINAWGIIGSREWDNDNSVMHIEASGAGQYFNQRIIAPPAAATGTIILPDGSVTTAYDTLINDVSLGSVGVALVAQALSWPGAPTAYILPAAVPETGRTSGTYRLVDYKRVKAALDELTKRADAGPDFSFDARLSASRLSLEYVMRAGAPFLGSYVGDWVTGVPLSPITGLKVNDDGGSLATHVWMQAGRTGGNVLVSRARNASLISAAGYPVLDLVDTGHTDVALQPTLDAYAAESAMLASSLDRSISFNVKGNATPALGQYRPGDWAGITVAAGNYYLAEGTIPIRITSISGDETGDTVKIGCDVGSMP